MTCARWATLLVLAACGRDPEVCPPADAADPEWADANGDGSVDLSDGVRIARASTAGGAAPVCVGQGDLLGSGDVAMEAATHLWNRLFLGAAAGWPAWEGCTRPLRPAAAPACTRLGLSVELADARVEAPPGGAVEVDARVRLRADPLQPQGWSFGLSADGCEVLEADLQDTVAASTFDDPPGLAARSFTQVAEVEGGLVSAVVLDWRDAVAVDAADGVDVLRLVLRAEAPDSGCATCTLRLRGDLQGPGEPVALIVDVGGTAYTPAVEEARLRVCAE
jgi:hypothetical protein